MTGSKRICDNSMMWTTLWQHLKMIIQVCTQFQENAKICFLFNNIKLGYAQVYFNGMKRLRKYSVWSFLNIFGSYVWIRSKQNSLQLQSHFPCHEKMKIINELISLGIMLKLKLQNVLQLNSQNYNTLTFCKTMFNQIIYSLNSSIAVHVINIKIS